MSIFGNFDKQNNLSELNRGLNSKFGFRTAAQRQALARANLGIAATNRTFLIPALGGKIGNAAGWVVTVADNIGHATLPASQTAKTLIIPIGKLEVGDIITSFSIQAQIESAGGVATLDADLRSMSLAAADIVDASVGAITQVSVTADTASVAAKTGLTETVTALKQYYILLTGTTAASTDIDLIGCLITIKKLVA